MKVRQGRCTFEADEAGRVLDRLAGLEKVIPLELIRQVLIATGRVNCRACQLTYEVIMWVVLAMGLLTDLPIRQVFKHARRLHFGEETPGRSNLCIARIRLGVAPLRVLFHQVVRPLATPDTPGAFYKGYRLVGIDGVVFDVPDTPENDAAFGRPSAGDRGDGAFPQIRKLSLVELGTHVEIAFVMKRLRCGEKTMVDALLKYLTPDMLLLWDRGFFAFHLWEKAMKRGAKLLARVPVNAVLNPIKNLSDGSYLAKIYPNCYDRQKDRNGIVVRVIRYKLDDPRRVGHDEEHILITNLFDPDECPAQELIGLYHERWEEELTFDEQKTHQDPRRPTKPTHLRSKTPRGVIQEIYALSIAHFVVRSLMFNAAKLEGLDPDRLSFTGCFHILQCRLPECDSRTPSSFSEWYQAVLLEMSQEKIEPRRNRINPRVIKRKMSKWPKKRTEHYRRPPLTKTFQESVVMVS